VRADRQRTAVDAPLLVDSPEFLPELGLGAAAIVAPCPLSGAVGGWSARRWDGGGVWAFAAALHGSHAVTGGASQTGSLLCMSRSATPCLVLKRHGPLAQLARHCPKGRRRNESVAPNTERSV